MPRIIFIIAILNCFPFQANTQIFEIYCGTNYALGFNEYTTIERGDSLVRFNGTIGYQFGYQVNIKDQNRYRINTGLEIMNFGLQNYDSVIIVRLISNGDTIQVQINEEKFKVLQIRVPVVFLYKLPYNWKIELGISPSYYIRKNATFLYGYEQPDGTIITKSGYNKFHIQTMAGISKSIKQVNFRINYNYELIPYFDTGKEYIAEINQTNYNRQSGKLHYFSFNIGYFFNK